MSEKFVTLKNAHLFDPGQGLNEIGSVVIEGDQIVDVLKGQEGNLGEVIDLGGKVLTPGFIDLHVHFREPGQEHKETIGTGSRSAAAGGFTTVCCMPNTKPANDSALITQYIMDKIKQHAVVRVHPIGAITKNLEGTDMAGIGGMLDKGCVALSDDGRCVMDAYMVRKTMEYLKSYNVPVIQHAEDYNLVGKGVMNEGRVSSDIGLRGVPNAAEDVIVSRDITLSAHTGGHLHVAHISSKGAAHSVAQAKKDGLRVTAEVTPHHLLLTDEKLRTYDSRFKMAPPLRTEEDRKAMVDALASGVIDCIATDHAPHAEEDKDVEFESAANGVLGLETAFSACYSLVEKGDLTFERLIESLTSGPAKVFNFDDRGAIKKGMKADFAVIDKNHRWKAEAVNYESKSRNCCFEGMEFNARVVGTFVGGKQVYDVTKGIIQ